MRGLESVGCWVQLASVLDSSLTLLIMYRCSPSRNGLRTVQLFGNPKAVKAL